MLNLELNNSSLILLIHKKIKLLYNAAHLFCFRTIVQLLNNRGWKNAESLVLSLYGNHNMKRVIDGFFLKKNKII